MSHDHAQLASEFDRQIANLLDKGYPALASLTPGDLIRHITPLKERLSELPTPEREVSERRIPFVIVIKRELVDAQAAMPQIRIRGAQGIVDMNPLEPASFAPVESLHIPGGMAYLLVDVDTGQDTLNVTPADAFRRIAARSRHPLTIDEGVALLTHYPQVLEDKQTYNAFSMLGSRRGDQRVPAMWISYGKPRLGWCWDRNPHTWLGSASCSGRLGVA